MGAYVKRHFQGKRRRILFPLRQHGHWQLVEIDLGRQEANLYSSLDSELYTQNAKELLKFVDQQRRGAKKTMSYQFNAITCPKQRNSVDCGLYVYYFMKALVEGREVTFSINPAHAAEKRVQLTAELLIEGRKSRLLTGEFVDDDPEYKPANPKAVETASTAASTT